MVPAFIRLGLAAILFCFFSPSGQAGDRIFEDDFEPSVSITNRALRFYGNGVDDIDRIKIVIDDPNTSLPGPPIDVGLDFTLEFWMRASKGDNAAAAVNCGSNNAWINGNIILDRDRFSQGRAYGLSIANRRLVWGIDGASTSQTVCGTVPVDDGKWHHIAVTRREADGQMWIFVDGVLDGNGFGPTGDVSYPDDGQQTSTCGGLADGSDPFLVIGAEKHDCDVKNYPSYSGLMDEFRVSSVVRYIAEFTPPAGALPADADTVALFHMDEVFGEIIADTANVPGGPSDGVLNFGGNPPGPERVLSDAPTAQ